jgi:hypothetical protein
MFGQMTQRSRWYAASLLVALYALCVATPAAVLALGQSSLSAHCLAGDQTAAAAHMHNDGASHHHPGSNTHNDDHEDKCCGLFGVIAIVPQLNAFSVPRAAALNQPWPISGHLTGRSSKRIDRPPKSFLSV